MFFKDLGGREARELINLSQVYEAYNEASKRLQHSYSGSMFWKTVSDKEYLYHKKGDVSKSLGPRSSETERIYADFTQGKSQQKLRVDNLQGSFAKQSAIVRALRLGRLDPVVAKIIRRLGQNVSFNWRIVGTNALFLYENMAGVRFGDDHIATEDIDVLVDDRKELRILVDSGEPAQLAGLVRSVDKSFEMRNKFDFRLTNDKGYMIEFIRPEGKHPSMASKFAASLNEDDVKPAPIDGLQWLVNVPSVEDIVLDLGGLPVEMKCPDPRYFAAHKLWVSRLATRKSTKAERDHLQAIAVLNLIASKMPHLDLGDDFVKSLPLALRPAIEAEIAKLPPAGDLDL